MECGRQNLALYALAVNSFPVLQKNLFNSSVENLVEKMARDYANVKRAKGL